MALAWRNKMRPMEAAGSFQNPGFILPSNGTMVPTFARPITSLGAEQTIDCASMPTQLPGSANSIRRRLRTARATAGEPTVSLS